MTQPSSNLKRQCRCHKATIVGLLGLIMPKNRSKRGGRSHSKRKDTLSTPNSDRQRMSGNTRKSDPENKAVPDRKTGHKRKCDYKPAGRARVPGMRLTGQADAPGSSHDDRDRKSFPDQSRIVTDHAREPLRSASSPPRELLPTTPANHFAPCLLELKV